MFETLLRKLNRLSQKLYVRVIAIATLSLTSILFAKLLDPLVTDRLIENIGGNAVNHLLDLLANSMLLVTTFSVTVMVSVFHRVSTQWSPRVQRQLTKDPVAKNVLATFVGAFLFALVSLILREMKFFGESEAAALFIITLCIFAMILYAIIRWIVHLETFGGLIETGRLLESETLKALELRLAKPFLGGRPLRSLEAIPRSAVAVPATQTGYLRHVFEAALEQNAKDAEAQIYVTAQIGAFYHQGEIIAHRVGGDEALDEAIRAQIVIDDIRTLDQDPHLGLLTLSEIASKALSPGINDPGTAIEMIHRIQRVLAHYRDEADPDGEPAHPNLWLRPIDARALVEDTFIPIARDGATTLEVQIALQRALNALAVHPSPALAEAATAAAAEALARAEAACSFDMDLQRIKAAAAESLNR